MEKHKKIMTVTSNASIDTMYYLDDFNLGVPNRTGAPIRTAGGKGLNVARVIRLLGEEVIATGFLGGAAGRFIHSELKKIGIQDHFVEIEGETRTCLALIDSMGRQTEVLEYGPLIRNDELEKLKKRVNEMLNNIDIIVVSGSLPQGTTPELYQHFLKASKEKSVKLLLDTSGQTLAECLPYTPFMIKPNLEELEQILGKNIEQDPDIWEAMDLFSAKGISLVIVSNGEKGAFASFKGKRYKISTVEINTVSAVGSGDSFVAGIAVGLARDYPIEETLAFASACGAANAMESITGFVQLENVLDFIKRIKVQEI
jgi:tagatose 6-phosphate kinase